MPVPNHTASWIFRTIAGGLLALLLLVGCSKSGDNQPAAKGQVVAHVGNDVITVSELDNEFRLANVAVEKQKQPEILKRILGDLVLRKYLVQQALSAKLDREPGVLLDILRAREQVLASAFISRNVATKAASISQADVAKYIESNPHKFANRQLFEVEQITFPVEPETQSFADSPQLTSSLDEVDQKLNAKNIPHNRSTGLISSGDIPQDLLTKVQANKAGEVLFARAGSNGIFFVVKSETPRPIVGEAAIKLARQLMRAELQKAELGLTAVSANYAAKYEGDYAAIMNARGSPELPK
jgi:EpsD family peptidyl-prolyl cis-trans isomerase